MGWLNKLLVWLMPQLQLRDAALRDKWQQEDWERLRRLSRSIMPPCGVAMVGHYLAIDLHLGLSLNGQVLTYRGGLCLLSVVFWVYFQPSRAHQRLHPRAAIEALTVMVPLGLISLIPLYPDCPPSLPGLLTCVLSSLCTAAPLRTCVLLGPLLWVQHRWMCQLGYDPLALASVEGTGALIVVFVRGQAQDIQHFLLRENADRVKREASAKSLRVAEELLTICPREIKRRVIQLVEARQLSAFQSVDEIMKIRRREISCLTSDIRGYTSASKDLNFVIKDVVGNIQMCTDIVEDHGGIPALTGDGLFVILDEPRPPSNHLLAALIGFNIAQANQEWNTESDNESHQVRRFVTMASGEAAVGNIGGAESARLYTALGTPANLVSRIDVLTKSPILAQHLSTLGPQLILSASAHRRLSEAAPNLPFRCFDLTQNGLSIRDFEDECCLYFVDADKKNKDYIKACIDQCLQGDNSIRNLEEFKVSRQRMGAQALTDLGATATLQGLGPSTLEEGDEAVAEYGYASLTLMLGAEKKTMSGRIARLWAFGMDVVVADHLIIEGPCNVDIDFTNEGRTQQFPGAVASAHSVDHPKGTQLALRFHKPPVHATAQSEKRRQERWSCNPLVCPVGIAPHPIRDNDFFVFRVKDVSVGGMQLITGSENRTVAEGTCLEAMMTFPQIGNFFANLKIRGQRSMRENGARVLALNVEFVHQTAHIHEIIGRYIEQFSLDGARFDDLPFSPRGAAPSSKRGSGLSFAYATTQSDFSDVQNLRQLAAEDRQARATITNQSRPRRAPLSDSTDARARILTLRSQDRALASTRIRRLESNDASGPLRYCSAHQCPINPAQSLELSWTVFRPHTKKHVLAAAMFSEVVHALLNTGKRFVVGSCEIQDVEMYRSLGCCFPGKSALTEPAGPAAEPIFYVDLHALIAGQRINPLLWSLYFRHHRAALRSLTLGTLDVLEGSRLSFNSALAPLLYAFAERRYLQIDKKRHVG